MEYAFFSLKRLGSLGRRFLITATEEPNTVAPQLRKCRMGNEEWGMWNEECGMGNEEWGMKNVECGMGNGE